MQRDNLSAWRFHHFADRFLLLAAIFSSLFWMTFSFSRLLSSFNFSFSFLSLTLSFFNLRLSSSRWLFSSFYLTHLPFNSMFSSFKWRLLSSCSWTLMPGDALACFFATGTLSFNSCFAWLDLIGSFDKRSTTSIIKTKLISNCIKCFDSWYQFSYLQEVGELIQDPLL